MIPLDQSAWFLPPGLQAAGGGPVSAKLVREVAERLKAARRDYLTELPVAEIVEILDAVVESWLTPDSPWMGMARSRIAAVTPYSEEMVRLGLRRLLGGCRKEALVSLLEAELQDPRVLDGFWPRSGASGRHRAWGPALTTHIFSGNVPGLPAISLMHALLVKSASLGKPASEEPSFAALFAQSIAALDPKLATAVAIIPWMGGVEEVEQAAFAASDAVVAYGSDVAIESVRRRVPTTVRFVGHGHRLSLAVIGKEALRADALADLARQVAYDVSLFDQQGCVSAQLVYVERGGASSAESFAERLAASMADFEKEMPRGRLGLEETLAIRQARTAAEMGELRGESVRLMASPEGTAWTVIYEEDPRFVPSCLNRVVRVKALDDLEALPDLLRPIARYLQSVGAAMSPERRDRLAEVLGLLGVCRVCPIGQMPHPPFAWHHDGGWSLLPLLKWTAIEE